MTAPLGNVTEFRSASEKIAASARDADDLDQEGLVNLFAESGFFSSMGYGALETDARCSSRISQGHAEITLCSFTGGMIALLEFLRPGVDLSTRVTLLEQRARDVLGKMLALAAATNGTELWLFRVNEGYMQGPPEKFNLADMSLEQARILHLLLQRSLVDWGRNLRPSPVDRAVY